MTTVNANHTVKAHAAAGLAAMLLIAAFLTATVFAELSGEPRHVAGVKSAIADLLFVLVPLMAVAGAAGNKAAGAAPSPFAAKKKRRMKLIFLNGVFILIPAALGLDHLAQEARFDALFFAIQSLELVAGAANLTLLTFNFRDGIAAKRNNPVMEEES